MSAPRSFLGLAEAGEEAAGLYERPVRAWGALVKRVAKVGEHTVRLQLQGGASIDADRRTAELIAMALGLQVVEPARKGRGIEALIPTRARK